MKKILIILTVFLPLQIFAGNYSLLAQKLERAIVAEDLKVLDTYYSWLGVDPIHRDQEWLYWRSLFKELRENGMKLDSVSWIQLKDIEDENIINSISEKTKVRGRIYTHNLKVAGAFKVKFKGGVGPSSIWLLGGLDEKMNPVLSSTKVVDTK